ncbi:MAG: topoisomerase DNA-binding C4 zinc finger domain-containing protein [Clostridia bacterium]
MRCQECDGNYILRDGKFGVFAGCSNYPRCRSTKKLYEVVLRVHSHLWNRDLPLGQGMLEV